MSLLLHDIFLPVELYRYYGFFALGACGCLLFTEVAKWVNEFVLLIINSWQPHSCIIIGTPLVDSDLTIWPFASQITEQTGSARTNGTITGDLSPVPASPESFLGSLWKRSRLCAKLSWMGRQRRNNSMKRGKFDVWLACQNVARKTPISSIYSDLSIALQALFSFWSLLLLVLLRHLPGRLPASPPQQLPPLRWQPGLDHHLSDAQGENLSHTKLSFLLQVFRPFLQFGMISLAFWISLTRYFFYVGPQWHSLFLSKDQRLLSPPVWRRHRSLGWHCVCLLHPACDGWCLQQKVQQSTHQFDLNLGWSLGLHSGRLLIPRERLIRTALTLEISTFHTSTSQSPTLRWRI